MSTLNYDETLEDQSQPIEFQVFLARRDITEMKETLAAIRVDIKAQGLSFVTKEQHANDINGVNEKVALLQKIVYGAVGIILTAFMLGIAALVINQGGGR